MFCNVANLYKFVPLVCKFFLKNVTKCVLLPDTLWSKWFLSLTNFLYISYPLMDTLECRVQGKGETSTWEDEDLAPRGRFYQVSEHRWNKCMRNGYTGCWANSLSQLLSGILLAFVRKSDCAYTSCHSRRLQALIKDRLRSPSLRLCRQQLMPCGSSGAVATGAAVWFMGMSSEGINGYCIR